MKQAHSLLDLQREVIRCERCPRLRAHCERVARMKRRAYRELEYWGKPVPSFGDPDARLLIIGLAPAAHGANRTGRMFTGDSSGDFLYQTLFETGFASQPTATSRDDGLELRDAYLTAAVRCAPPGNKPTRAEFEACRPYLQRELELLKNVEVVAVLGRLALDSYLAILQSEARIDRRARYPFAHGARHALPDDLPILMCSYHPSRQNTQTGRLTKAMFLGVFKEIQSILSHNLSGV